MRTVYKFLIPFASNAEESPPMPVSPSAPIRLTGLDPRSGQPAVWLEVETEADQGPGRRMMAFGTGHDIPKGLTHVGSLIDGSFVWHIYELPH